MEFKTIKLGRYKHYEMFLEEVEIDGVKRPRFEYLPS